MYFELYISIARSPSEVFAFFRDKDKIPQDAGSPVLLLEKTTPGPPGVGTQYREVVQMLPYCQGEIRSTITCFEPDIRLQEDFEGAGMTGQLTYQFIPEEYGTKVVQCQTVHVKGLFRIFGPLIQPLLGRRLKWRLEGIRRYLESSR